MTKVGAPALRPYQACRRGAGRNRWWQGLGMHPSGRRRSLAHHTTQGDGGSNNVQQSRYHECHPNAIRTTLQLYLSCHNVFAQHGGVSPTRTLNLLRSTPLSQMDLLSPVSPFYV